MVEAVAYLIVAILVAFMLTIIITGLISLVMVVVGMFMVPIGIVRGILSGPDQ